jgi:hypothetical protein
MSGEREHKTMSYPSKKYPEAMAADNAGEGFTATAKTFWSREKGFQTYSNFRS